MHIIAGKLSGRTFSSPRSNQTHPMSDKIRGALFNVLGDITDLTILDAFAGSGALSFEAVSRGAKKAVAIDENVNAYNTIIGNAQALGISADQIKIIRANCFSWSANNPTMLFDVVIVDPPYEGKRLNYRNVFKMADHVELSGLFVVSLPPKDQTAEQFITQLDNFRELNRKNYGDAQLVFCRRIS